MEINGRKMHYAENECAMPIRLHCNELRALCQTTNALCRSAEIGALLLKCVLIVYNWPEKGVVNVYFSFRPSFFIRISVLPICFPPGMFQPM